MELQIMKDRARALRREGKSIGDIVRILNANKSTVSYWCRNIALTRAQQSVLALRQRDAGALGRLRAAELKRAKRRETIQIFMQKGAKDVGHVSRRDLFMLGLALYWGEGYKLGNDECGITNSDPSIILMFISWTKEIYEINRNDLILRVSINEAHRRRVKIVEKYWSEKIKVPLSQFTKTSLIHTRSKKQYLNGEQHFGTLRVKVRRGTSLRRRIMGSIDALRMSVAQ